MIKQEQEARNRIENLRALMAQDELKLRGLEEQASEGSSDKLYQDIAIARVKLDVTSQELAKAKEALEQELARLKSPEYKAGLRELDELKKMAEKRAQAVGGAYEAFRAELEELEATCKQYDRLRTKVYGVSPYSFLIDKHRWASYLKVKMQGVYREPKKLL